MVKAYRFGKSGHPDFPSKYDVGRTVVLQLTDLEGNNNKFYGMEIHSAGVQTRIFTHYGRVGDNGVKECRYFLNVGAADREFSKILKSKKKKGYEEVNLAKSNIGSDQARGKSAGEIDEATKAKAAPKKKAKAKKTGSVPTGIADVVKYLYDEATNALTTAVNVKITADGMETPLGVLTLAQIQKGEKLLKEIHDLVGVGAKPHHGDLFHASGAFYKAIPHKLGRTRAAIQNAVIDSLTKVSQAEETLQLMTDMLTVDGDDGSVLFQDDMYSKYKALGCSIEPVDSVLFKQMEEVIHGSQVKGRRIKVKGIYQVRRKGESEAFKQGLGNVKRLFHGSRIRNWVGILSRGILLPKLVVASGRSRTDTGWLGHGIYFGDAACTSVFYTSAGRKGTRFLTIARVAMGKVKRYTKRMYGMDKPPKGYDSCHGVPGSSSQFSDNELVIYDQAQQQLEYLVEFNA